MLSPYDEPPTRQEPVSPDPETIEQLIESIGPLEVLFCHGCTDDAHRLHQQLEDVFLSSGVRLWRDPFEQGDDVQVAMRNLTIHGVIYHADEKSTNSVSCKTELRTAGNLGASVLTLCDGVSTPSDHRHRIAEILPARATISEESARRIACQMRLRARTHWVLQWLAQPSRCVEDREAGAAWLCRQPSLVLAEFFRQIIKLHYGKEEDPTVCTHLAAVLERSNLRDEAREVLEAWLRQCTHPLPQMRIEEILQRWNAQADGINEKSTATQL